MANHHESPFQGARLANVGKHRPARAEGLGVAQAYRLAGDEASFAAVKAALGRSATAHIGATGSTVLNTAGDRDGGAFDFWSLKPSTNGYGWCRSASFRPQPGGNGTIIRHQ